jgi:hypothetical protein
MKSSTTSRASARELLADIPRAPTMNRLLDRQVRLLEYLTSSGAIFGDEKDAPADQALEGIDRRMLRLEARFSHEKRMEKIIAVFPNTFRLLGPDRATIVREFVNAFPPADSARMENARQFYDFLCDHWRNAPPEPPYLNDVAACEFACAGVRGGLAPARPEPAGGTPQRPSSIRRNPNSVLLRCGHDVRTIFEDGGEGGAAPTRRDTLLAIVIPPGAEHPRIFEMPPPVFDVLGALDDWVDRSELGSALEVDELIGELAQHGLVEVRM